MDEAMNANKTTEATQSTTPPPEAQPQQNSLNIQPPADIKDDKSKRITIKIVIASLLLLWLVLAGIALNWNFFRLLFVNLTKTSQVTTSQTQSNTKPTEQANPTVSLGTQTLEVIPGRTSPGQYTLVDKETIILFGSSSVPDLVFGKNYSLNDIHNINYLPIKKEISFYNKGYFMVLTNQGCNTENRFSDVPEVWVTDCSIQVTSSQTEAPIKQLTSFDKTFSTKSSFGGLVTQSEEPLIYLTIPKLSVQNFSTPLSSENVSLEAGSMTSYSTSTAWDIQIITSYGIETIRYTAQEIWDKETKQVTTGPLTSTSKIDNLDCKVIFTGDEGQQTERCDVTINLSFGQNEANITPIKLSTYME